MLVLPGPADFIQGVDRRSGDLPNWQTMSYTQLLKITPNFFQPLLRRMSVTGAALFQAEAGSQCAHVVDHVVQRPARQHGYVRTTNLPAPVAAAFAHERDVKVSVLELLLHCRDQDFRLVDTKRR